MEKQQLSPLVELFRDEEGLVDRKRVRQSKYEGLILGGAIGDALGMPVEDQTREQIQERYGPNGIQYYMPPPKSSRFYGKLRPGQYTDDTQLILATIRGIFAPYTGKSSSLQKHAKALSAAKDSLRGAGRATWTALNRIEQAGPEKSGIEDAMGTGAMTRLVPYLVTETSDVIWEIIVEDITRMTHNNETSVRTVFTYGQILNELICEYRTGGGGHINLNSRKGKAEYLSHYSTPYKNMEEGTRKLKQNIAALAAKGLDLTEDEFAKQFGTTGAVWDVLPAAVYAFLRSPRNFEESLLRAVNLGGDTDTIGFVTGQLSGAYNGVHFIPDYLINGLENHQEIRDLAIRLFHQQ